MDDRIDPSIPLEDEEDGQRFFDAVFASSELTDETRDALEGLDYRTAACLFRAIRNA